MEQIPASKTACERATKDSQTRQIFKEGAYGGFPGATAGGLVGATIGVVTKENVGSAAGKEAAGEASLGGLKGYTSVGLPIPLTQRRQNQCKSLLSQRSCLS